MIDWLRGFHIIESMKLFGVPIRIHPSFLWLLLFLALVTGLETVAWILVVFAFVVLHELTHCLVARAHGIPVLDIMLLPIGGVARLGATPEIGGVARPGGTPEHPGVEFRIAIAGPLFNLAVAALAYVLLVSFGPVAPALLVVLLQAVLIVNLGLGIFNLLPAFPMDGGRVLRAFLTTRVGYLEATHRAARVGRWVAGLMAVVGVAAIFEPKIPVSPIMLLLVAGFVYVSGKQEEMAVAARHATSGLWRFFGFGEPMDGGRGGQAPPRGGAPPDAQPRGDVIDVEGRVRPKDDGSAASAFHQLSEDIESQLKR